MALNIIVCVKPIPDPEKYHEIKIDPQSKTIIREGVTTVLNPGDKHAIEEGLKLRERFGGKVSLISMAPPNSKEAIYQGLAMGADEAFLLSDKEFAGGDTLATSYVLAQGIKKIGGAHLILTGTESGDGATAQVPAQLGEWLGISNLWGVIDIDIQNTNEVFIKTKFEDGYIHWQGSLPLVLAVAREINKPRYTTIMGVMKAKRKPFQILSAADLDLDHSYIGLKGSPTQPGDIFSPQMGRRGELIKGEKGDLIHFIMEKLEANGVSLKSTGIGCEGVKDNG